MNYMKKVKYRLMAQCVFIFIISLTSHAQTHWLKYQLNPVMGEDLFNGFSAVKPFVIEDKGLHRMVYTAWDMNSKVSINEAVSFNGVRWYQLTGPPLLTAGCGGSFDEFGLSKACLIKDDEGYKLYYYTENKNPHSIGVATSADGLHWIKHRDNPILVAGHTGSWDGVGVWAPMVIYDGDGKYRMYYQGSRGEYVSIGYAVSDNGIHWEKFAGNPVLRHGDSGEFDELTCGEPNVVYAGGRYHMFFTGTNTAIRNKIGYAYSEDGISWTKYDGNPVLDAGSSYWENQSVAAPTVIYKDSIFHMWYSGWCAGQAMNIGYAISVLDTVIQRNPVQDEYQLGQNYPNPFNHGTHINYNLPRKSNVVFKIYDLLGQEITTLTNEEKMPGDYTIHWDADGIASGIYFYRIITNEYTETRKMALKK